jgi:hypothetical protein
MSTNSETKINRLLQKIPPGTVILSQWLLEQGYSRDLQHRYLKNAWLTSIGYGAFKRTGDNVSLYGAIYALQQQAGKKIHIGGRSALGLLGYSHYLELYKKEVLLFAPAGVKLPSWLRNNIWEEQPLLIHSSMLPVGSGLVEYKDKTFSVRISGPERGMMECLFLTPHKFDLVEAWHIMEGLTSLVPENIQNLLEQCRSVKVIRLFLYLAEKAGHSWFKYIDTGKLNFGKGKRSIVREGVYIPKYQITVPESIS